MAQADTHLLQQILLQTLQGEELACAADNDGKTISLFNGLQLQPFLMASVPMEDGQLRVSSVVEVSHPKWIPNPIFEYQHSTGDRLEEALLSGFTQWARMDLVTLIDACAQTLEYCAALQLSYNTDDADDNAEGAEYQRQVLLGPMAHFQAHSPTSEEEHEFCPCCLFTNSMPAFTGLLKSHDFLGVRLYASRDEEGQCEADCRVNGRDFEDALPLLREYAASWPEAGFEFRKQYVVIRNLPSD